MNVIGWYNKTGFWKNENINYLLPFNRTSIIGINKRRQQLQPRIITTTTIIIWSSYNNSLYVNFSRYTCFLHVNVYEPKHTHLRTYIQSLLICKKYYNFRIKTPTKQVSEGSGRAAVARWQQKNECIFVLYYYYYSHCQSYNVTKWTYASK